MSSRAQSSLRWLRGIVLAVAAVGSWSSAQAIVYSGVWDPPYGAPFANLGWSGSVRVSVPDYCVPPGAGVATRNNYTDCANGAFVETASVRFYDINTLSELATVVFNASSIDVFDMEFTSGNLTGLEAGSSLPETVAADLSDYGVAAGTQFFLSFTFPGDNSDEDYQGARTASTSYGYRGPILDWVLCPDEACYCDNGSNDRTIPFNQPLAFQRVPEPGTLALAALGLLILAPRRARALLRRGA